MQFFQNHKIIEGNYNLEDIKVLQNIGNGNSSVYSAKIQDKLVAMKQIFIRNQQQTQSVHNQIALMKQLSEMNINIIRYQGYFLTARQTGPYNKMIFAYIIMEKGITSLESYIQHKKKLRQHMSQNEIIKIFGTIIKTLQFLQNNKIAHCDIKPQNIIIMNSQEMQVKICDIGSCKVISKQQTQWGTLVGTVPFLAPELVRNYSNQKVCNNPFKSDVFSLGLCLVYLVTFKKFKSAERLKIDDKIYKQVVQQWIKQSKQINLYDDLISELLDRMLEFDDHKRNKFKQIEEIFQRNILLKQNQKKQEIQWAQKKIQQQIAQKKFNISLIQYNSTTIDNNVKQKLNKTGGFKIRKALKIQTGSGKTQRTIREQSGPKYKLLPKMSTPIPIKTTSPFIKKFSVAGNLNETDSPTRSKRSSPQKRQINNILILINKQILNKTIDFNINWEGKSITLNSNFWLFQSIQTLSIISNQNFSLLMYLDQLEKVNNLRALILNMNKFKGQLQQNLIQRQHTYFSLQNLSISLKEAQMINFSKFFKYFLTKKIKKVNLNLSQSNITPQQILQIVQYLSSSSCQKLTLILNKLILNQKHNKLIMQHISKSTIQRLVIHVEQNSINYSGLSPWPLPKTLKKLTMNYQKNKISSALNSLCLSLAKAEIQYLNLNLSNCSLSSKQINFLFMYLGNLKKLEVIILNLSYNRIDDQAMKYICSKVQDIFMNITVLQFQIYGTDVTVDGWSKILNASDKFFSKKLRMNHFKLSYDRFGLKTSLINQVKTKVISDSVKIDLIFHDSQYFSTYLRRKPVFQIKNGNKGFCKRFQTNYQTSNHYICLTCKQEKQIMKNKYYCQFCIYNCNHKTHNFVRTYEMVTCCCAFSGQCKTDLNYFICSNNFQEEFQKGFYCLKCNKQKICISCISDCKKDHENFVKQYKDQTYFWCRNQKFG